MPFSSGTHTRVYNWVTESGSPPIEISKLDTEFADVSTALNNCLLRDGTGLPTAAIPFNSQNITGAGSIAGASFIPSGATVPTNGLYLSAANTIALASNTTLRYSVNSTGNHTIAAPSSGTTVVLDAFATAANLQFKRSAASIGFIGSGDSLYGGGVTTEYGLWASAGKLSLLTGGTAASRFEISTTGNVTINAPSSGITQTITSIANGTGLSITDGSTDARFIFDTDVVSLGPIGTDSFYLRTNATNRVQIASTGNVTINAPSSGTALSVTAVNTQAALLLTGTTSASIMALVDGQAGTRNWQVSSGGASAGTFTIRDATRAADCLTINSTGNVTVNAPSSGISLSVTAVSGGTSYHFSDGTVTGWAADFGATRHNFGTSSNHSSYWYTNNTPKVQLTAAGNVTINAPTSGVGLTVSAVSGTHSTKIADSANTSYNAGFLEIPVNTQDTNYTCVLADSGKAIYHTDGTGRTYTIPANASVAYPVGTTLTFVNDASAAVNVTIAITTDTLVLSPGGTTGSRTLAQYGRATAHKVTATRWIVSGTGLT